MSTTAELPERRSGRANADDTGSAMRRRAADRSLFDRLSPRREPAPLRTLLYALVCLAATGPLREVFHPDAARDRLLYAVAAAVLAIAGLGLLFRMFGVPWWLHPFASVIPIAALLTTLIQRSDELAAATTKANAAKRPLPSLTSFGLDAARQAVADASSMKRPTTAVLGFVLVAVAAIGALTVIGNLLVFDLDAPFEALVPPGVVLVLGSTLGPGHGSGKAINRWSVVFVVLAAGFVLYDAGRRRRALRWAGHTQPAWGRTVAMMVVLCALTAAATGSMFRAVGDRYVHDPRSSADRNTRRVASPIVSLRPRLLELSNTEMFTVDSRDAAGRIVGSYWRQSALDRFDGAGWSQLPRSFSLLSTSKAFPTDRVTFATGTVIRQSIRITGLTDPWVPIAYRSARVATVPSGTSLAVEASTGNVLLSRATAPGDTFVVLSTLPVRSAADTDPPPLPDEVVKEATDLSAGVNPAVRNLAKRIMADAGVEDGTALDKAAALESFFRKNFTYSTKVVWHGADPLVTFLQERTGYCEQFSSAFAVLARTLGIPTRVAVGFTAGRLGTDGLFHVTGKNAHAWPEILIPGRGWVPFEPTPGRELPRTTASTSVGATTDQSATVTLPVPNTFPEMPGGLTEVRGPSVADRVVSVLRTIGLLLLVAAAIVGIPVIVLLARVRRRRALLRRGVPRHVGDLECAWAELVATLEYGGFEHPSPATTPLDVAGSVRSMGPKVSSGVTAVATELTTVRFAPDGDSATRSSLADAQTKQAASIDRELRSVLPRTTAVRRSLGLRPPRGTTAPAPRGPARRGRRR